MTSLDPGIIRALDTAEAKDNQETTMSELPGTVRETLESFRRRYLAGAFPGELRARYDTVRDLEEQLAQAMIARHQARTRHDELSQALGYTDAETEADYQAAIAGAE